jgi:lipoprotein-releasing system permease protein
MNPALRIARRYLFAKRSTNAINIISGIAVFGISVGAAALVLVLSVFNGFEDLILGMYNRINPDIKITVAKGKTFVADSLTLEQLYAVEGVETVSLTLEEIAVFTYKNNRNFGILKGVDDNYNLVTGLDSSLREGVYDFERRGGNNILLGLGMRNRLEVNIRDEFTPVDVYMLKRKKAGPFEKQFLQRPAYPAGTYMVQTDFDAQYVISSLDFARQLLNYSDEVSALEIKLRAGTNEVRVLEQLRAQLGSEFVAENRYEQEEAFLKLMKMEKWLSYAIVGLMMALVAFNLVGALWLIVLEKKKDIAILKSMGASAGMVRNIFLLEGALLSLLGTGLGFMLALLLFGLQKSTGLIAIPGNMILDAYPISLRLIDFATVSLTVVALGLLASWLPARKAQKLPAIIIEE